MIIEMNYHIDYLSCSWRDLMLGLVHDTPYFVEAHLFPGMGENFHSQVVLVLNNYISIQKIQGGAVVSAVASQQEVPGFDLAQGLPVFCLHVLFVSGYSGLLLWSEHMQTGD